MQHAARLTIVFARATVHRRSFRRALAYVTREVRTAIGSRRQYQRVLMPLVGLANKEEEEEEDNQIDEEEGRRTNNINQHCTLV